MAKKTACGVETAVFRCVTRAGTVDRYQQFGGTSCLIFRLFYPQDEVIQ